MSFTAAEIVGNGIAGSIIFFPVAYIAVTGTLKFKFSNVKNLVLFCISVLIVGILNSLLGGADTRTASGVLVLIALPLATCLAVVLSAHWFAKNRNGVAQFKRPTSSQQSSPTGAKTPINLNTPSAKIARLVGMLLFAGGMLLIFWYWWAGKWALVDLGTFVPRGSYSLILVLASPLRLSTGAESSIWIVTQIVPVAIAWYLRVRFTLTPDHS